MRKLILMLSFLPLLSCSWFGIEEKEVAVYPCLDGNCGAAFQIDPVVSPGVFQDKNEYWHIKYWGPRYFTIVGKLDELHPKYVLNKVPLVEIHYDSDYWVAFESLTFKIPIYSVLSWFTDKQFNNPIPIGTMQYTLTDIAKIQPPLNIAGYQINKNFCWECPYAKTLLGTYSKYNYTPRQQFYLDRFMVGDTLNVMVKTTFNTDLGERVVLEKSFKIVVEN